MARYTGPVCRLCRREGAKLFLKGERCMSDKCAYTRRSYYPGQHGQRRGKFSEYGSQLREKQKCKRIYGLFEMQFSRFFDMAERAKGPTGDNLLILLERRLDNMVYRMGFTRSRAEARQLIRHNHFTLNGKKVNIPAYLTRVDDVIEVTEKSRQKSIIMTAVEQSSKRGYPGWLEVDPQAFKAKILSFPTREEIPMEIKEQLIVELYSK